MNPTTLAGIGMAAIGSFPIGGSLDPFKGGIIFFLDDVDLIGGKKAKAQSLEMSDEIGAIDHLEYIHQELSGNTHLSVGRRVLLRNDTVNLFLGRINKLEEVKLSGNTGLLTRVQAVDLTSILDRRLVTNTQTYTNQAAGIIVKDLVNQYLTNEGITTNSVQNGPTLATFTVEAFTTVGQAIRDIGDRTGYIAFVDPLGDLNFVIQTEYLAPFNVGSTAPNEIPLNGINVQITNEKYRNRQTVKYGNDLSLSLTNSDTGEQTSRAAIEGGSGIYHSMVEVKEVTSTGEADALATALLRRFGKIPKVVEFSTHRAGLRAGQAITLEFHELGTTGPYLIDKIRLADQDGMSRLRWDANAVSGEHLEDSMQFWRKFLSL